ncbi:hypothetical protein MBLNU13_g03293t1 [Cladosporium sp. NU13]
MATMEKRPGEGLFQASDITYDESFLHNTKSSAADARDMARMGKPQEMKRNFGTISMFGFSVILMASWEAILSTAALGLTNGGSAGFLYTCLATWLGFITVYASLGEMGSMAPTSGGQFHWVSEFSPKRFQRGLSYIVGWLGVLGWEVGVAISSFLAGTQIQALLVLNYPDSYVFKSWHGTLFTIAILSLSVTFNTFFAQKLHLVEIAVLILHVAGFFCILITLLVLAEKAPSKRVWTTFYDPGWGNQGLSCLIGIVASTSCLLGADAAAHMAEELQDASYRLPRVMLWATIINGGMMFVMAVTVTYCIGDLESVLSTPTGYPYIQIFYNVTRSLAATNAMTALILILGFFGNVTVMAGSSRQLFAFARDEGMPFSKWIAKIHPAVNVPVNAIFVISGLAVVIALINLGSTAAFNIVTSLGTGTLTVSYIICISIIIWRKVAGEPLLPSRFNMGRVFGLCVNIVALGWLCLVFVIAFFPSVPAPLLTMEAMNWSVVVFLAVVVFSAVYFVVWGRKSYVGPVEYVRKLD